MPTSRMRSYVPLAQEFSSRVVFFHSAVAERLGLHLTDLKSLHLLAYQSMTAGVLGEEVGLTPPAMTALIDRLEKAGFVVRKRDSADRRQITIHAVPEKLRELDEFYKGQYARMSKFLTKYSDEEFSAIVDFLEQTSRILGKEAKLLRDKTS